MIFHSFFNDVEGVGIGNVDIPLFFNGFWGSNLKMLIYQRFFNDFGGFGLENIDFALFFSMVVGGRI